ncbi:hypothetical protein [Halobaculum sp. MBLA0143]|uniref:DUF7556 family protein n=1 Tax=Halobaculum sp. MBLA0143 TaxID=3079933 RepID=UPI0035254E64
MSQPATEVSDGEVVAALDEASAEFVIADIARDDAWLAVGEGEAPTLRDWC